MRRALVPGQCIDRKTLDICTAFFNFFMDVFILLLPQRVVWKLQMTNYREIGIFIVFPISLNSCEYEVQGLTYLIFACDALSNNDLVVYGACISASGRIYSTVTLQYSM